MSKSTAADSLHVITKRAALLVLATCLVYGPALRGTFLWDDRAHVPDRPEVYTGAGLQQIWTLPGFVQQYYPLTFTTVWLEHHFFGERPRGYHVVTLLFHALSAVLVAMVLAEMGIPGAWGAAFLFALHPMQVESVAWISELKNTQSTFFTLLSFWCYWRSRRGGGSRGLYAISLISFLAALLSKTTSCVLPLVLLLAIVYREYRVTRQDLLKLCPFLIVGVLLGLSTARWEKVLIGAIGPDWDFSFAERCLIAGRSWWFYLGKLLWPHPLMFMYPKWIIHHGSGLGYWYGAAALWSIAVLWAGRHLWGTGAVYALMAYTVLIGPALGFISIYPMRFSWVADHYVYMASIPLFALAAASLRPYRFYPVLLTMACLGLAFVSSKRLDAFQNPELLWRDTLAKNPDCVMAHLNLSHVLSLDGRYLETQQHIEAAAHLAPSDLTVQLSEGYLALNLQHDFPKAIFYFKQADDTAKRLPLSHVREGNELLIDYALGLAFMAEGQKGEARIEFENAQRILDIFKSRPWFDITPEAVLRMEADIHYQLGNES